MSADSDFKHGSWAAVCALALFLAMICFLAVTCSHSCAATGQLERVDRDASGRIVSEVCRT